MTGHTLAILGLGGIGLRLAEFVHTFPMRVVYHNRRKVENAPEWCEYYGSDRLDEMLAMADVLSVHVPLRDDTVGLVDEKMIRKLKKGAVIVNTARGKVIDEAAMIRALEDGHVGLLSLVVDYTLTLDFRSCLPLAWMCTPTNLGSIRACLSSQMQRSFHTWALRHVILRRRWRLEH